MIELGSSSLQGKHLIHGATTPVIFFALMRILLFRVNVFGLFLTTLWKLNIKKCNVFSVDTVADNTV